MLSDDSTSSDDAATSDVTPADEVTAGDDTLVGEDAAAAEDIVDSDTGGGGLSCSACHGSDVNPAPPKDLAGNTATTERSIGAHQSHLGATIATPIECAACHVVPEAVGSPGHTDSALPAELTFGALAQTAGAVPAWDPATATCTTYCHGATIAGGGTNKTPVWTKVDGTQKACGTCHAMPPKAGRHPANFGKHAFMGSDCTNCHGAETNKMGTAILQPELHINGTKNVVIAGGTWNATSKSCNPACHGAETWK